MISLLLSSFLSTAQAVPMQLSQQGRLVDSSGAAAAGNHNLTFRLYNAGTGGTLLWNETCQQLEVSKGDIAEVSKSTSKIEVEEAVEKGWS